VSSVLGFFACLGLNRLVYTKFPMTAKLRLLVILNSTFFVGRDYPFICGLFAHQVLYALRRPLLESSGLSLHLSIGFAVQLASDLFLLIRPQKGRRKHFQGITFLRVA
jgi:hypothetical protein